mmetsp:Transcript_28964/g.68026  ORF Transcript_28964/g.68026 Transcript_28964/m.68026 type:complete len:240 (-) Transcript_28964:66-785(-)
MGSSPPPVMNICRTLSISSSLSSFIMSAIISLIASGLLYRFCAAFIPSAALAIISGSPSNSFIWSMLSFIFCSKYSGSALNFASSSASTAPVSSRVFRISSWWPSMFAIMSSPPNMSMASCICLARSSGDISAIIFITSSNSGRSIIPFRSSGLTPICFIMASISPRAPPPVLACSLSSWKLAPRFFFAVNACPLTDETATAEKETSVDTMENFMVGTNNGYFLDATGGYVGFVKHNVT